MDANEREFHGRFTRVHLRPFSVKTEGQKRATSTRERKKDSRQFAASPDFFSVGMTGIEPARP